MNPIQLRAPYLLFFGSETELGYAKTGIGLAQWRKDLCVGQCNLPGGTIDVGLPEMSLKEAASKGVKSIVIGTAPVGGKIPDSWLPFLFRALTLGLDIVSGLHQKLESIEELKDIAAEYDCKLIDIRVPPAELPVGSGKKRLGKRLLMVGTDCAVGKKYTALQLEKDMQLQGINADFRATGQTGIMIAGTGVPIDAVVSDFISGAAELVSPNNVAEHWDVIEGQGGIFHPGYSAVSLGLLIGSQPDAFVVCHDASREHIMGWDSFSLPTIPEVIERTIELAKQVNPDVKCVGVSINSSALSKDTRKDYLDKLSTELDLPCVDPLVDGTSKIIDFMTEVGVLEEKSTNS